MNMSEDLPQHTRLEGIADYTAALDTLCKLAQRNLYLFDQDFDGFGYNTETRFATLRNFLLAGPAQQLFVLAHDTSYLSTRCPRMMTLLHQFGTGMFVHQTPKNLHYISEPFAVSDQGNFVRRFHFDDPRGILARHDPEQARTLQSRFLQMWAVSHPTPSTAKLRI